MAERTVILGRNAVDDGQPCFNIGTVADIGLAGDRGSEDDPVLFLKTHEAVAPTRLIGPDIVAGDSDKAPALGKAGERRAEVPYRGLSKAPLNLG